MLHSIQQSLWIGITVSQWLFSVFQEPAFFIHTILHSSYVIMCLKRCINFIITHSENFSFKSKNP